MGAVELRNIVLSYIKTADEWLLEKVKAVVENYNEKEVAAYSLAGGAITGKQYLQELREADEEIKNGQFTPQEDLEKEADTW